MATEPDRRTSVLALLRSQHAFPGPFEFRVVVLPEAVGTTVSAVVAAAGGGDRMLDVRERVSRNGTYRALRIRAQVDTAEVVLDVYEVLRGLEGVVTSL